jgi:uncharacterized membrane protein YcaP (DUF421 family)
VLPARVRQGLHNMGQIQWAVLESDGKISIIPQQEAAAS